MVQTGEVQPDTVITVNGTKAFADSISGIVFDSESSAAASPTVSEIQKTEPLECYQIEKKKVEAPFAATPLHPQHQTWRKTYERKRNGTARNIPVPIPVEEPSPFDTASEPRVQVDWVPSVRRGMASSGLREPLSQVSAWIDSNFNINIESRHVKIGGSVFAVLCLLGILMVWLVPGNRSLHGAVHITGTLTLDGKPVDMVNVTLHPRIEDGYVAGGMTDKSGRFRVRTGMDLAHLGAVPGEYDVTFRMRGVIPVKYECPRTSGLAPIRVELTGKNSFSFELSSAVPPPMSSPEPPPRPLTPESPLRAPTLAPSIGSKPVAGTPVR